MRRAEEPVFIKNGGQHFGSEKSAGNLIENVKLLQ
jgi:hypothetical protein